MNTLLFREDYQAYSKFIGIYLMDEINTDATVSVSPTGKSRIIVDLTKS